MRDRVHHNVALEIKSLVDPPAVKKERETLLGNDKSDEAARTRLSANERNYDKTNENCQCHVQMSYSCILNNTKCN